MTNKIDACLQVCADWGLIPTSFRQCMTWEEQVLWLMKFLQDTVIPTLNSVIDDESDLSKAFDDLKIYVNNYFNNLDAEGIIDDKLDEMASDGTLARIINESIFSQLNDRITQNSNSIESLEGQTVNNSSNIARNTSNITNLTQSVSQNTSDIATQTSRIDALSTLEEGSTTGDAELIDGRTNAFGKVSASIGDSIRNYEGANFVSIVESCRSVSGKLMNFAGAVSDNANGTLYSFPTEKNKLYYIATKSTQSAPQIVIGDRTYPTSSSSSAYTADHVIEGTGETCYVNYFSVVTGTTPLFIGETSSPSYTEEGWEDITASVDSTEGKFIGTQFYTEALRSSNNYICYEFYPEAGYEYLIHTSILDNVPFIRQLGTSIIMPTGTKTATFSGTFSAEYNHGGKIYVNGLKSSYLSGIKSDTFIKKRKINSLQDTYPMPEVGSVSKLVCVGDSLMKGQTFTGEDTSYTNFFNIPHFLSKRLGCETTTNISRSGATSTSWWNAFGDSLTDSNALYVVWLGTNDNFTDTVSTDCAGNDYTQYAQTETGDLGRIVGKINSLGNNKIVLLNCFATSGNLSTNNKVIKDIADKFNATVVDIFNSDAKVTKFHTSYTQYFNGVHFNNAGHNYIAGLIAKEIGSLAINGKLEIYKAGS